MLQPIKTSRLSLSPVSLDDLQNIHQLHSLPETDRFNTLGIPKNLEETKVVLEACMENFKNDLQKSYTLKVALTSTDAFIGLIALNLGKSKFKKAEVWYQFHPDFWNKGYATETLQHVLEFGFNTLKLHRIEAGCAVENTASMHILEKVGMTQEGRKRQVLPLKTAGLILLSTQF